MYVLETCVPQRKLWDSGFRCEGYLGNNQIVPKAEYPFFPQNCSKRNTEANNGTTHSLDKERINH